MKIPFSWTPTSWALRGKMRERARIEYELTGYEHDERLIELDYTPEEQEEQLLDLKYEYDKIDEETYRLEKTEYIEDEEERKLTKLEVRLKFKLIDKNTFDKETATVKGEPWVYMPEITIDPENPSYGGFHIDCNDHFIEWLRNNGFDAPDEDQILNHWLNAVCRNIALEAYDGIGDFNEQLTDKDDSEDNSTGRIDDDRWYKE